MEMEAYIMTGKMIYFGNKLHWVISLKVNVPTSWLRGHSTTEMRAFSPF